MSASRHGPVPLLFPQGSAAAAIHEMEPDFEIRLAERIEPRSKSAAADELAIAVIEQRPILNATGPLPLDLGAELLSDLGIGEFAAGINERRDGGIPPQFHRKGQIHDLPWPRHKALGPEFFRFPHDRRREWPYSCASQRYRRKWDREILWGGRRGDGNFLAECNRWSAAMPQPNDLSRSLVALD